MKVKQEDFIKLPTKLTRTKEGFLKGTAPISRSGVFVVDGIPRLRPESEIEAAVNGVKLLVITDSHPFSFVNTDNVRWLQKGFVGEKITTKKENDELFLRANFVITDEDMIKSVLTKEVTGFSLGYELDIEQKAGMHNGQHYVEVQKNCIYNHLALVKNPRMGTHIETDGDDTLTITEEDDMEEVEKLTKQIETLTETLSAKNKQIDSVEGERDALKATAEALQKQVDSLPKAVESAITEAVSVLKEFPALQTDSLDAVSLKIAAIKQMDEALDVSGKSSEYVNAVYDTLLAKKQTDAVKSQAAQVAGNSDTQTDAVDKAREAYIANLLGKKGD